MMNPTVLRSAYIHNKNIVLACIYIFTKKNIYVQSVCAKNYNKKKRVKTCLYLKMRKN